MYGQCEISDETSDWLFLTLPGFRHSVTFFQRTIWPQTLNTRFLDFSHSLTFFNPKTWFQTSICVFSQTVCPSHSLSFFHRMTWTQTLTGCFMYFNQWLAYFNPTTWLQTIIDILFTKWFGKTSQTLAWHFLEFNHSVAFFNTATWFQAIRYLFSENNLTLGQSLSAFFRKWNPVGSHSEQQCCTQTLWEFYSSPQTSNEFTLDIAYIVYLGFVPRASRTPPQKY